MIIPNQYIYLFFFVIYKVIFYHHNIFGFIMIYIIFDKERVKILYQNVWNEIIDMTLIIILNKVVVILIRK